MKYSLFLQVPDQYLEGYDDISVESRRNYAAMVTGTTSLVQLILIIAPVSICYLQRGPFHHLVSHWCCMANNEPL